MKLTFKEKEALKCCVVDPDLYKIVLGKLEEDVVMGFVFPKSWDETLGAFLVEWRNSE